MGSVAEKRSLGLPLVVVPPQIITLQGVTYRNLSNGLLRFRCTPNLYLKPGDTAVSGDDSFMVDIISFSVSAGQETYEVAE